MSEENKIVELKDDELNQVSGGVAITGDIVTPSTKIKITPLPHKEENPSEKPTPKFVICPNCGAQILPRCSCPNCGYPDNE